MISVTLHKGPIGPPQMATAALDAAITVLPPTFRRRLMVTCDGAGASHALLARLDTLAARPGYQVIYSVGWELGEREKVRSRPSRLRPVRSRSTGAARSASAEPKTPRCGRSPVTKMRNRALDRLTLI